MQPFELPSAHSAHPQTSLDPHSPPRWRCPWPAWTHRRLRCRPYPPAWRGAWLLLILLQGVVVQAQFAVTTVGNPNYNPTEVRVVFSQPVGPSGLSPVNYLLEGQPATTVAPGTSPSEVVLATPVQTPGRPYTITIRGSVTSAGGGVLAGDINRTWQLGAGVTEVRILQETWDGVPGTQLSALTDLPTFPDQPTRISVAPAFGIVPDVGNNYGVRLHGLFVPPTSGDYQFYISSDDEGALYLSTSADPANMERVAHEPSGNGNREYINGSNQASRGNPPTNISPLIPLTAGQEYYLEARMKEGNGGDNLSVTVRRPGGPPVVNGSLPLSANLFAIQHLRHDASGTTFHNFGGIRITTPPEPQSVVEGTEVTLRVGADGSPPHEVQWLRNGEPVPGAHKTSFTFAASGQTAGSYSVRIRNLFSETTSQTVPVDVAVDSTPPTVTDVTGTESRNVIRITFSEPVDSATAILLGNYAVDGGLTLEAVTLANPQTVQLNTSLQNEGATYTLQIRGVEDVSPSGNPMNPTTATFQGWTLVPRGILHERWNNAGSLADLANKRAAGPPDQVTVEPTLEYPSNGGGEAGSFYVNQLTGVFIPPVSGNYVFYLAADDQANAYLSTDSDPAHYHLVAKETTWTNRRYYFNRERRDPEHPENRSNTFEGTQWPGGNRIQLDAGTPYSIGLEHFEAEGGDHVSLTYQLEGQTLVRDGAAPRFGGENIGFYADPERLSVQVTDQPDSVIVVAGKVMALHAAAVGRLNVQTSSGSLTIPVTPTYQWERFVEATGKWISQPSLGNSEDGSLVALAPFEPGLFRYRVIASLGTVQVASEEVAVTVLPDTFPPLLIGAFPKSSTELNLVADENLDPATAQQPGRYRLTTLGGDLTPIVGAALQGDGDQVTLTLQSPMTQGMPYLITATGLRDPAGNEAPPQSAIIVPDWTAPVDHILRPANPDVYLDFNRNNWITLPNLGIRTELGGIHVGPEGPTPHPGVSGAGLPLFGGLGFGNRALELTGNNRVEIQGGSPLDKAPGLTVMALVKPGPMSETKIHSIASQEGVFALRWYDWDRSDGVIKVEFDVINGGFVDGDLPDDDQWHLITGIADGTNLELYVDDQKAGSRLSPILPDYGVGTGDIQVGIGNVFDDSADLGTGFVDLIALWRGPSEESFISDVTRSATLWRIPEFYTPTVPESVRVEAGERFELPVTLAGGNSRVEDLLLHAEATPGGVLSGALTITGDDENRTVSGQVSPGATGSLTIRYSVSDGRFFGWASTLLEVIPGINLPPEALPDRFDTREDEAVSGNLLSNDRDPEGQALSLSTVPATPPTQGTVVLRVDGLCTYTPTADFNGIDTFAYSVSDSQGATATATVTVTVTPVNDEPFFVKGGDQTVNSELPLQTVQAWATSILPGPANEAGQNVEFLVTTDRPDLFAVAPWVSPGGTLTYQPSPGANGVATVTVRAKDDGGTANDGRDTSEPQSFTITVRPDAPIRLTINLTPDNTPRIHWVDPGDRLHLEVTPSLSPESWTPVLEGVEQQGTDRLFQIPGGEEGGYWRLQITEPLAPDPQSAAETLIQKLDLEPGARVLIRGPVPPETTVVENSGEVPRPEVLRIPSREGDYYIVIADPTPGLKHGHPMKYGWIDLDTQETGQASGEWPADILVPNEEPQPYHLTDSTVIEQAEVRLVTGSGAGTVRTPAGPEDAAVHLPGAGCKKIALVVDGGDKEAEERHLANIMALDADRFAEWLEDNQFTVSRRSQARRHPSPHFSSGGFGPALNLLARIEQIGATEFSCDPDPGCCHEFFLYVGSHGSRSRLSFYDASGSGQVSFLYYDELFAALAKFPPCVKIVVFVDSCYAGVAQNFLPLLCAGRPCGATIVTAVDVSWSAPGGLPFETDSATQDFLEPKARFDGDGDGKVGDFRDRWMHMKSERESVVPLPATCPGQSSLCSTD